MPPAIPLTATTPSYVDRVRFDGDLMGINGTPVRSHRTTADLSFVDNLLFFVYFGDPLFFGKSSSIKLYSVTDIEQHMVGLSHSYSVFMV